MTARLAKDGDQRSPRLCSCSPRRKREFNPGAGRSRWIRLVVVLAILSAAGCSLAYYRRQADNATYRILAEKGRDERWAVGDFEISPDPRSRFYDPYDADHPPLPPDDPTAAQYMECVYGMRGWRGWREHGQLEHVENPSWPTYFGGAPIFTENFELPKIEKLSLSDAIEIGLIHSRDYQEQLENVYLAALALTYQRYRFDVRPLGFLGEPGTHLFYRHQPDDASELQLGTTNLGVSKLMPGGAQFVAELTNNTLWMFSSGGGPGTASTFAYSLVQPLFGGAGREIVLEALTQSERNALYAVRRLPGFVRPLLRYYGPVRLPSTVHVPRAAMSLLGPIPVTVGQAWFWGRPVPLHGVSTHAQGLRLRGVERQLAPCVALRVAFPITIQGRHTEKSDFGAQWLACVCPCQRFTRHVTMTGA